MHNVRKINETLYYVGAADTQITRFENMYPLEDGMQYNSYLFLDNKTALMDTIDSSCTFQFIENIKYLLQDRKLDYLVIHHMEPDHCANIENIVNMYPDVKIVGNKKIFDMIEQFFSNNYQNNYFEVKEGDSIDLGENSIEFLNAPMVHWPEVMMSYEKNHSLLFSADAFGAFGALKGNIFSSEIDFKNYIDEFRRYYTNIVGKFGIQVSNTLKKLANKNIEFVLPLHGYILDNKNDISYVIDKYTTWASYEPEQKGVVIAYATMHGNTQNACYILANELSQLGVKNIEIFNVSKTHPSYIISRCQENSHLVLTALSYYSSLYPSMKHFIDDLTFDGYKKRTVGYIFNSTWGSAALKEMQEKISTCKDINTLEPIVNIKSSVSEECLLQIKELAIAIKNSL